MDDWRILQFPSAAPASTAGNTRASEVFAYRSTATDPAAKEASLTPSDSSARPPSTRGKTSGRIFWKSSVIQWGRYLKSVRLPSRVAADLESQLARISGSIWSRYVAPFTAIISAKPCAAPLRSTDESSERMVSKSQGLMSTTELACRPDMPFVSAPSALAAAPLTSGRGSTSAPCSSGIRLGRYGDMSFGSFIRVQRFPTILAARFLTSPDRSLRPR
mmetsp:Transcript_1307/g.4323  ORF Transcript_1307/g.4323 Transcript_1307/m.4323 type:complete len:218 (-) Transcript_1307:1160-1813(-)